MLMINRGKKIIVTSMLVIWLASFIIQLILFCYLRSISPRIPNMATGEIYPLNDHGYIFYVRKICWLYCERIYFYLFVFGLGGGILNLKWKIFKSYELPKKPPL